MPNIMLVNIRFRLDCDDRDKVIHDALFQHPDGRRNQIIKDALYAYLICGGAEIPDKVPRLRAGTAGKQVAKTPDVKQKHPAKQKQETGSQNPPDQAEAPPVVEPPDGTGEEQQVMTGLRSLLI